MKIHPDQVKALDQEQVQAKIRKPSQEGFGEVLAKEVQKGESAAPSQGTAVKPPVSGALSNQILAAQGVPEGTGEKVPAGPLMENLESLLSEWENYAATLQSSGDKDLRPAFGVLEEIESGLKEIKDKWPTLSQDYPGLKSVVDELEVLAVTERIKFNRGDYLE